MNSRRQADKKQVLNLLYSEEEMESIKNFLQVWQDRGKPRFYEIYVGDCMMMSKTDNLDEFDLYKLMLRPTSRTVRVKVFLTAHNRNNFEYVLNIPLPTREGPLNGIPGINDPFELADQLTAEKLKEEEAQMYKELYEEAKSKLEQLAQEQPEPEKKSAFSLGALPAMIKNVIQLHPTILKDLNLPFAEALTGIVLGMEEDKSETPADTVHTKVTFEPFREGEAPTGKVSQEEHKEKSHQSDKPPADKHNDPPAAEQEPGIGSADQPQEIRSGLKQEYRQDVAVMEEFKSAFSTQEERNKAMVLIRMLGRSPETAMAILDELIKASLQGQQESPDQGQNQETDEYGTDPPLPENEPPETSAKHEDGNPADLIFIEELNL